MAARFITLEGIEGAGKSTLRSKLVEKLTAQNIEVVITREPGATSIGRSLRNLLLNPENSSINPITELMMFSADRAQHLSEIIRPALARGAFVLCDRFIHSTLAYQGYGRGLNLSDLQTLTNFVTAGLQPDLVLLLDLDPTVGLARVQDRQERASGTFQIDQLTATAAAKLDRMEELSLDFHRKVRQGFLTMAQAEPQRFAVLDASKTADAIAEEAFQALRTRLKL